MIDHRPLAIFDDPRTIGHQIQIQQHHCQGQALQMLHRVQPGGFQVKVFVL
jgi:hypothetical protein